MNSLISLILPAYNAQDHIKDTIDSILNQTHKNFELIIIDDGSTDRTANIINTYKDARIKYIKNDENLKLIKTLNKGISIAQGQYIARIDADDICHPKRLEKQLDFLQSQPDVAVVGTDILLIDSSSNVFGRGIKIETRPSHIHWNMRRRCCLYHPSVMINKNIVGDDLFYNKEYVHAEDYELWLRLSSKYKLSNIDETLLFYRIHNGSITQSHNDKAISSMLRAINTHQGNWNKDKVDPRLIELIRFPQQIDSSHVQFELISILLSSHECFFDKSNPGYKEIKRSIISFTIITSFILLSKFKIPSLKSWKLLLKISPNPADFITIFINYSINVNRRVFKRFFKKNFSYYI